MKKSINIDKNKTHEAILFDYEVKKLKLKFVVVQKILIDYLNQEFQANKMKLDKLKSDLKAYDDLPPNINLAKTKLDELAKEIVKFAPFHTFTSAFFVNNIFSFQGVY